MQKDDLSVSIKAVAFASSHEQLTPQEPPKDAKFWLDRLEAALKREEPWIFKSQRYMRRYRNEEIHGQQHETFNRRYNIFYANTELLKSALLPEIPSIFLQRRFAKEQIQDSQEKKFYTTVSEIIERVVSYNVKTTEIEREFEAFKYDYLITGRGVLWVSYDADFADDAQDVNVSREDALLTSSDNAQPTQELNAASVESERPLLSNPHPNLKVTNERILVEHVNFKDFRMSSGKKWSEIWWVARRVLMNRKELVDRFGEIGQKVELTFSQPESKLVSEDPLAEIWEVWDKTTKKVYLVSQGFPNAVLDEKDDPYHLTGFFPTVEPLRSIRNNDSLIPVPELDLYLKEAHDLSINASRIASIVSSIKPRAFCAVKNLEDAVRLNRATDNEIIGVEDIGAVMENGGMSAMFAWDPIEVKQAVASGLYQQQQNLIQNIYEITGISDIMRNISPQETATATLQKGRFGSLRLQDRQASINNYVKAIYTIATEMVCELFSPKTLASISSMQLPTEEEKQQYLATMRFNQQQAQLQAQQQPQQPLDQQQQPQPIDPQIKHALALQAQTERFFSQPSWENVKQFMENTKLRAYLIDIETSFNLFENEAEAQKSRIDLLNVFSDSLMRALPVISQTPEVAEVYLKMISFALDSFRVSRAIKNSIDDSFDAMIEKFEAQAKENEQTNASQKPSPDATLAQAEMLKAQAEQQNSQTKLFEAQQNAQTKEFEAQLKQQELQIKAEEVRIKGEQVGIKLNMDAQEAQANIALKAQELQAKGALPLVPDVPSNTTQQDSNNL